MTDNKEFAKAMKENPCKDSNGNVICSPVLWEIIANLIENSSEIINRQQAEIDGLKSVARRYKQYYFNHEYDILEANAIKDFAERLKKEGWENVVKYTTEGCDHYFKNGTLCAYSAMKEVIDNLVKEMIGEQE